MTQAALGGERLSESYVSLIESGRRQPGPEIVEYLADALSCTVEELRGVGHERDAAQAELLIRRGEWELDSGQTDAALSHLHSGMDLARSLDLPALVTRGRAAVAKAFELSGQLRQAASLWEELRQEAVTNPENAWAVHATVALSRCYRELGDLDRAIQVGEELWQRVDPSESVLPAGLEDLVIVGATLLGAYIELGDKKRSDELAADLLTLAETADTPKAAGAAYWNASLAALADGRTAEALRLAEKAQASMALTHDVRNKARLQTTIAGLHLRLEPPDTARALHLLETADPVLTQFGSKIDISYCRTELARAHLLMHHYHRARDIAADTLATLRELGENPIEAARTLMVLAAAEAALQDESAALDATATAAAILEGAGATRQAAASWNELAELYVSLGRPDQAIEAFRRATALLGVKKTSVARQLDNPHEAPTAQPEAS